MITPTLTLCGIGCQCMSCWLQSIVAISKICPETVYVFIVDISLIGYGSSHAPVPEPPTTTVYHKSPSLTKMFRWPRCSVQVPREQVLNCLSYWCVHGEPRLKCVWWKAQGAGENKQISPYFCHARHVLVYVCACVSFLGWFFVPFFPSPPLPPVLCPCQRMMVVAVVLCDR